MTSSAISADDAVKKIVALPAPILFPDTCILVDLIRLPLRAKNEAMVKRVLQAANHLITQTQQAPPNLWIVICSPVQREWAEHSQSTIDKIQRHWMELDSKIAIAHASAGEIGLSLPTANTYSDKNIESTLNQLAKNFFDSAICLDEDRNVINRAYLRTIRGEAPSHKGNSQIKDCVIIEHGIEICTQLRSTGFDKPCVFATSNKKDFCNSNSTPRAPLDSQLSSINLSLTTNWEWTKAELGV